MRTVRVPSRNTATAAMQDMGMSRKGNRGVLSGLVEGEMKTPPRSEPAGARGREFVNQLRFKGPMKNQSRCLRWRWISLARHQRIAVCCPVNSERTPRPGEAQRRPITLDSSVAILLFQQFFDYRYLASL